MTSQLIYSRITKPILQKDINAKQVEENIKIKTQWKISLKWTKPHYIYWYITWKSHINHHFFLLSTLVTWTKQLFELDAQNDHNL